MNREIMPGRNEPRKGNPVLTAVHSSGLAGQGNSEADELRVLQEVSDWLEDGIGEASERRDLSGLLRHTRDRALLLLLFWRRVGVDELVSLHVEDMEIDPLQGLTGNVIGTRGPRQVNWRRIYVPALEHLCPVSAVLLWLSVSGLKSGPLFPRIKRCGDLANDGLEASSIFPLLLGLVARSQRNDDAAAQGKRRRGDAR